MHESSRHPSSHRASAPRARLRLSLAVLLLAGFSAGSLGGGVAVADDGPTGSGSPSGTTGAPTSQHTSQEKPQQSSPQTDKPHPGSDSTADDPGAPASPVTRPSTTDAPSDPPTHDAEPPVSEPPVSEPPKPGPTPTVDVDPTAAEPPVAVPHESNKHVQQANTTAPAAQPASRPEVSRPEPTSNAPAVRSVTAAATPPSVSAVTPVAPVAVSAAVVTPNPPPTIAPRLDLQLAGLAVDVATVTVSVVHTAATIVAQAFGPSSFLGVPYLLAMSVANAAAAAGRTLVGAPLSPPSGQFAVNYGILDGLSFFTPTTPPAGANDPSIRVTPEHPLPVILLNGTTATQGVNWSVGAPVLANAGYKVFTFNYGNTTGDPNFPIQAVGDIRQSGLELAAEVDRVLAMTGAPKVILIGHSQGGGILPVYYVNELGGADKVSQVIGIAPSNHGTDFDQLNGLTSIPILGPLFTALSDLIAPALFQQAQGSPFQQEVYGDGDTRPGVLYTTISSVDDEVVTPYTHQALTGPGVTNVVLQDRYPGLVVGHANIFLSPQAMAAVLDALAANPAANPLPLPAAVAA